MNESPPEDQSHVALAMVEARIKRDRQVSKWIVIGCGLLYGGISRLLFAMEFLNRWLGGAASATFLILIPFAMGAFVAFLGMTQTERRNIAHWGFAMPSATLGIGLLVSTVTGIEAFFCILVASPILWLLAVLGGLITALIIDKIHRGRTYITLVLLLPYAAGPIEQAIAPPEQKLEVKNRILIHATPGEVWPQIASVPAISKEELPASWIYRMGFPRPIAAVLEGEGPGAIRIATFERQVSFFERVTEWRPGETIAFTIDADPEFVPANAFDKHVVVGGRFYDVLGGRYRIENLGDGRVALHLSSHHRLNTHLGRYAGWWSEAVMDEIQGNILEVIRQRAEAASQG